MRGLFLTVHTSALHKSVRAVAVFEMVKGVLVLLAGCGLLRFLHKDVHHVAYEIVSRLHLNPSHKFSKIFVTLADNVTDGWLWLLAALAVVYAAFRFAEGYGLWKERVWAGWLAAAGGAIYLPVEIYELWVSVTIMKVFVLVTNLTVVAIAAFLLRSKKHQPDENPEAGT